MKMHDNINNPAHYTTGTIETLDFIVDKQLDFCLGNVIKYIVRAGLKDRKTELEDLQKAEFYLKEKIKQLQPTQILSKADKNDIVSGVLNDTIINYINQEGCSIYK